MRRACLPAQSESYIAESFLNPTTFTATLSNLALPPWTFAIAFEQTVGIKFYQAITFIGLNPCSNPSMEMNMIRCLKILSILDHGFNFLWNERKCITRRKQQNHK